MVITVIVVVITLTMMIRTMFSNKIVYLCDNEVKARRDTVGLDVSNRF